MRAAPPGEDRARPERPGRDQDGPGRRLSAGAAVRRRRNPRSVRTRIAVTVALAVAGCTLTVTVLAYELERHGGKTRFVQASLADTRSDFRLAAKAAGQVAPADQANAIRDFVGQRVGVAWRIAPARGHGSFHSSGTACVADRFPPGLDSIAVPGPLRHDWVTLCDGREYLAVYGAPVTGVSLAEFYDFQSARDLLAHLRDVLIWVDLAGLAAAVLIGALVGRQIGRPLREAAAAARDVGSGDLGVRMTVRGDRELSELADAFNDMATRIQHVHEQQRRFALDVSHELRTPLAAMLAAADGLSATDADSRKGAARLLVGQTRRLTRLVDDLLEIARFDAGGAALATEELDLTELIHDVVRTVAPDALVEVRALGDPVASVDPGRMHAVLRNLVGNAVQHGAAPIEIVVDGRGPEVVITVTDGGPGVDARLAPRVFDRFVRGDTSRSTRDGQATTGLGLAIAQENVALHGGSIAVRIGRPATFTVRLPRRAESAPDSRPAAGEARSR